MATTRQTGDEPGQGDAASSASATALAAYWRFFEAFNSRDAARFSAALHYPHVRVSPKRTPVVVPTAAAHAAQTSWDAVIASGWDHTEGHEPRVLHNTTDRAHIVGGWTRKDAQGGTVGVNRVVYIVTRTETGWGMQSRFATGAGPADRDDGGHEPAVAVVEEYMDAYNDRHWARCGNLLVTPHFQVDVGLVREWRDRDTLWRALRDGPWHFVTPLSTDVLQGGDNCAVVGFEGMLDGGDVSVKGAHTGEFHSCRHPPLLSDESQCPLGLQELSTQMLLGLLSWLPLQAWQNQNQIAWLSIDCWVWPQGEH